ncbi:MAG TPA: helix-turn-helix domain-containing protein [Candidatus Tumulicola sp.]
MNEDVAQRLVRLAEALARAGTAVPMAHELARHIRRGVVLEDALHRTIASAGSVPGENGSPAERRTMPVGGDGEPAGFLTVIGPNSENGELDIALAMRVAAAALAAGLTESKSGRRGDFWTRLSAGTYRDVATARDDAAAYGVTLRGAYIAVAFELDASVAATDRRGVRDAIARAFHLEDPSVGAIEDAGTSIVFVPAEREIDASNARANAELLARDAIRHTPPSPLWGGVGSVEPPAQLGESTKRALAALSIARRVFAEPRVAAYEALGAYPLLYFGADARTLQAFARGVLGPLRAYDESHQTELERTLRTYFETGENLKVAAARLNVHRHTVLYRLRQIGEICSRSLENHHDQLALRVAIAVDALYTA